MKKTKKQNTEWDPESKTRAVCVLVDESACVRMWCYKYSNFDLLTSTVKSILERNIQERKKENSNAKVCIPN